MAENKRVEIRPAKGRPMLSWVGKKPLRDVIAYPAQLVETFAPEHALKTDKNLWKDWTEKFPKSGLLFHGDNKDVLAHLLANGFRGKVKLIYIDPPFDSGADYTRKVSLRGNKRSVTLEGESYTLGEQIQYSDIWANDNYLQFLYERFLLLRELLHEQGSIYVHLDPSRSHYVKVILDEIFGETFFRNEIIWRNNNAHNSADKQFGPIHQNILFYSKGEKFTLHPGRRPFSKAYIEDRFIYQDMRGKYQTNYLTGPGLRAGESGQEWRGFNPSNAGRHWAIPSAIRELLEVDTKGMRTLEILDLLYEQELIIFPEKEGGQPMYKQYMTDGVLYQDLWAYQPNTKGVLYGVEEDIDEDVKWIEKYPEMYNYPTIKPEGLVERIIKSSSDTGEIVLDCFIGSGTTLATAQKLGRRWIGADINKGAIQTTAKRLQGIIQEQLESAKSKSKPLPGMKEDETPPPAQFSFAVYRVNDYDLQVQHNEALNLAVEHLGITRTKTDSYFDGTLGKKLVKIVPFNHPITPLDMEEVKRELGNRPQEERDVVVVGYGKELAVQAWLEDWNRNRKRTGLPNQIEAKDLRVDAKSGGFFVHKPAEANIKFKRAGDKVNIEIETFLSPTIIERLKSQAGLLSPQIDDWRAMVDSVMIDSAYDGKVFNITLADVPEKKNDLVEVKYVVEAKKGAAIAVKITDMLGEEVLVVKEV
jgi:adenine-specific DNA-methyltransferase